MWALSLSVMLGCSSGDDGVDPEPNPPSENEIPVAVDDEFTGAENEELTLSGLLDNDTRVDNARITSIDNETENGGKVVDNRDDTYTYTPPSDFIGEDKLSYTLCVPGDNDRCDTALILITITDAGEPVAVDDTYETEEDKTLTINNATANDQLIDNATIVSIDDTGLNGTAVLNNDGSILYTPSEGFSGEDSFTYKICDDDETPSCSSATISITVVDEGNPKANADMVSMASGESELLISNVLDNDGLIDDSEIVSVQDASHGSVALNSDGTITYTAETGFVGDATFTYTLCDDDSEPTCVTAEVTVKIVETLSFNIPAELDYYYSDAVFANDDIVLKENLSAHTDIHHVNHLEYTDRHDYLYDADADLSDPYYVVLMYSGDLRPWVEYQQGDLDGNESFNTEHIYPQSRLNSELAVADMHHLRVADAAINSERNNYPYTEGSGTYALINDDSWYPGDEWKGDVARMVMYVNLKYGESFSEVGNLEMFLRWNVEDPVSEFEMQRQEVIEGAQGNRNPFIDNPYLATLIWGGDAAENKWQ